MTESVGERRERNRLGGLFELFVSMMGGIEPVDGGLGEGGREDGAPGGEDY